MSRGRRTPTKEEVSERAHPVSQRDGDYPSDLLGVAAADALSAINEHPNPERAESDHEPDEQ